MIFNSQRFDFNAKIHQWNIKCISKKKEKTSLTANVVLFYDYPGSENDGGVIPYAQYSHTMNETVFQATEESNGGFIYINWCGAVLSKRNFRNNISSK
jgi:hypothetical protein